MKKKGIITICLIVLVISSSLASAGLLQDITSWFKDFFTHTEKRERSLEGELASLGAFADGSGDYGSPDYIGCQAIGSFEGELRCYEQGYRGGYVWEVQKCTSGEWIKIETCQPQQWCIEEGLDAKCTCVKGEKRCYEGSARSSVIQGVEQCKLGIWVPVEVCKGNCSLGKCENISEDKCSDQTSYWSCSPNPPLYCEEGNLIERCELCGCSEDKICADSGKCILGSDIEILSLVLTSELGGLNSTFFEGDLFDIYAEIRAEEDYVSAVRVEILHEDNLITSLNLQSRGDVYHSKWIANNILEERNDYTFRVIAEALTGEEKQRDFNFSLDFNIINPNSCKELIPAHNNPDANRVNVVFVGYGYKDLSESEENAVKQLAMYVLDWNAERQGLFSTELFKSNKDKFNLWYVDKTANLDSCEYSGDYFICSEKLLESNCVFNNKYVVYLVDKTFRSFTLPETYSALSAEVSQGFDTNLIFKETIDNSFTSILDLFGTKDKILIQQELNQFSGN